MTNLQYRNQLRRLLTDQNDRKEMVDGAIRMAQVVSSTLGPFGALVAIQTGTGLPLLTKDGASVAMNIHSRNHAENMAIQAIKLASLNTAQQCGDGTTTSCIIACKIIEELAAPFIAGETLALDTKEIQASSEEVCAALAAAKRPTLPSDIHTIAMVSSNSDPELSSIVAQAYDRVGLDGQIVIEEGTGMETKLTLSQGFELGAGWVHPEFSGNRRSIQFSDAFVWVVAETLATYSQMEQIIPLLNHAHKANKPLVIVADDIDGEVLKNLILNNAAGKLQVCAIRAPHFADERTAIMADLAHLTGARFRDRATGPVLRDLQPEELGTVPLVQITDRGCLFSGLSPKPEYVAKIEDRLASATKETERITLQSRIAKLNSRVAHILVGGASILEVKERSARYDDCVSAIRSSRDGVLPGAGQALVAASEAITRSGRGARALRAALLAPSQRLTENAGHQLDATGIIDPYLVQVSAIKNAVSVATSLLSARYMIVYDE